MTNHYEVVIIGSGAGGGTLARCLAEAGKKVLVLERGDWLPREPQNWDPSEVFQNNRAAIILWVVQPSFTVQLISDCEREILRS